MYHFGMFGQTVVSVYLKHGLCRPEGPFLSRVTVDNSRYLTDQTVKKRGKPSFLPPGLANRK